MSAEGPITTSGSYSPESGEPDSQPVEILLHGNSLELVPGNILIPKDRALAKKGINGDILALIGLPAGLGGKLAKELALIDFGNEFESNPRVPTMIIEGREYNHMTGFVQSRYGLKPYNYKADGHMISYVPLVNPETTIGRNVDQEGHMLGLKPGSTDVDSISRSHLTIKLSENDRVIIEDHSTNGTKVTAVNPVQPA